MSTAGKITIHSSREAYRGNYIVVVEEECELPSGRRVIRGKVKHPGAVIIVPVTPEGDLILISQYRIPLRQVIFEFPAGTLEKDEAPLACAKREIIEETGYQGGDWQELGILHPAPGFCDEVQHLFVASNLMKTVATPEEDEIIEVHTFSITEVEGMIDTGIITDGKTIATFARARLRGLLV